MNELYRVDQMDELLKVLNFAAEKHQQQRRKGKKQLPYINHPIKVALLLWDVGGVHEIEVLIAALLHDTLEDTDATPSEIHALCGEAVLTLIQEVTDDKSLPKHIRKQLQIEHAAKVSHNAKMIKLADKACNVYDLSHESPAGWSLDRIIEYMNWSDAVVDNLRGTNQQLEEEYDRVLTEARSVLEERVYNALS